MRTAHKVWSGIAAGVFGLVAVTDSGRLVRPAGRHRRELLDAPGVVRRGVPGAIPAAAPSVAPAVAGPAAVSASVIDVIDGDTFRLASGDEVRVLGIDSCEAATPGGQRATAAARARLLSAPVTLTAEPGVDRDRYGRMLRYVGAGGADFASSMVTQDHTAIYTRGRNDASTAVQSTLRRLDTDGRTCGTATPTTTPRTTTATRTPDADVDRPRTPRPVAPRTAPRAAAGSSGGSSGGGGYYANCSAARAAGAAPLRAGAPGYRAALDRDKDGVACE